MLDKVNSGMLPSEVMTTKKGRPRRREPMTAVQYIRLPELLRQRVIEAADAEQRTVGQFIRMALEASLGKRR